MLPGGLSLNQFIAIPLNSLGCMFAFCSYVSQQPNHGPTPPWIVKLRYGIEG
jgi:hypothetical protein